jgi:integrase
MRAGLRRSEVLGLEWRDVDLDSGSIHIRHGKGDKSRRVPLEDKELLRMLAAERVARNIGAHVDDGSERTMVLTSTYGTRFPESSFYKVFRRVLAAAELDGRGLTPHSLRHTFGSVLCARGVPVPYVKDLLGHEDIGSTMVYVHSTPEALRAAVRKLTE